MEIARWWRSSAIHCSMTVDVSVGGRDIVIVECADVNGDDVSDNALAVNEGVNAWMCGMLYKMRHGRAIHGLCTAMAHRAGCS